MDVSSQISKPTTTTECVQVNTGLGSLHRVCSALFSSSSEFSAWTDLTLTSESESKLSQLESLLKADPFLDFALLRARSDTQSACDVRLIYTQPISIAGIVIRSREIRQVSQPRFGPPDAVLDAATGWAIASALTLAGLRGRVVVDSTAARTRDFPESIESLSPVGIAWLISQSQAWARELGSSALEPLDSSNRPSVLEIGAGR